MFEHDNETPAERFARFQDAVARDPAARRLSDLATSPPPKDIASLKAAVDVVEAEEHAAAESGDEPT